MLQSRERIPVVILENHEDLAWAVAQRMAAVIRERNGAGGGA